MSESAHSQAAPAAHGPAPFKVRWDGTINVGTLLHLLVLMGTLTAAYYGLQHRLGSMESQQQTIVDRITGVELKTDDAARRNQRIELYLQGKDRSYWKAVRDYENAMPAPAAPAQQGNKPPEQWRRPHK